MFVVVVLLTMLVLPIGSVLVEHASTPAAPLVTLAGRWFVFWGVGVRLGLAGLRQIFQPRSTARNIFNLSGDEAFPLIRELGVANAGAAVVAILSIATPTFVLPAALSAGLFFLFAGIIHLRERGRSLNENVAMVSDIFIATVLFTYVALTSLSR